MNVLLIRESRVARKMTTCALRFPAKQLLPCDLGTALKKCVSLR